MNRRRSKSELDAETRRNEAARRELARADRRRSPTRNLEEALSLQEAAEEFRRAFESERTSR